MVKSYLQKMPQAQEKEAKMTPEEVENLVGKRVRDILAPMYGMIGYAAYYAHTVKTIKEIYELGRSDQRKKDADICNRQMSEHQGINGDDCSFEVAQTIRNLILKEEILSEGG